MSSLVYNTITTAVLIDRSGFESICTQYSTGGCDRPVRELSGCRGPRRKRHKGPACSDGAVRGSAVPCKRALGFGFHFS